MKEATSRSPVTRADFARGFGATLLARLGALVEVVAQPIYVWLFGLPAFGIYAILWATVNLVENIADLGMTAALQRVVPQAKSETEAVVALRSALLLGVVPCLLIATVASIAAPRLAPLLGTAAGDPAMLADALRLFAWALPLWAFLEIATSALRARRLFGAEIRVRIMWEQLIRLVLAAALWPILPGIAALLVAHLLSLAIAALLALRLLAKSYDLRLFFSARAPGTAATTLRAGLAALPTGLLTRLFGDSPPILLGLLIPGVAGASAAGLYVIARKISSIVQLLRIASSYVLAPLASAASHDGMESVQAIYAYATRLALALVLPLGLLMAAASGPILSFFGPEAHGAKAALVILVLARVAEAVLGAAMPVQQVVGGYRQQIAASASGLAAAVAVGWPLMQRPTLDGMAIAAAAGFLVAAMVPALSLARRHGIHPFTSPFWRVALRAAIVAVLFLLPAPLLLRLDHVPALVGFLLLILGALWTSGRFALPGEDRIALGGVGRRLGLS